MALKMVPPVAISSSTSRQSLPSHVADDRSRPRLLVVAGAPLVDERDRQIEPLGEAARVLGLADVGGDHHRVRQIVALEALAEHRHARELIGRHREEALDLRRVQIDRQHAVGARRRQHVGHQARGDRDARLVLLVAARVRKVRQHRGHPPRRRVLERIEQDEQLDDVLATAADRPVCTTNTSSSRTFSSILTLRFSFEKRVVWARPSGSPSCVANFVRQLRVRRAREHLQPVCGHGDDCVLP